MTKRKILVVGITIAVLLIGLSLLVGFARDAEPVAPEQTAWLESTLIMHRGLHDDNKTIPENSLAAFAAAIEEGYIIELDVSMTKDQQLVVFHDKKLKRVFGLDKYLNEVTYDELSRYRLFDTDEKVPLFREVLAFVDGQVPLLIEIKNEGEVGEMESLIYRELEDYEGLESRPNFISYEVTNVSQRTLTSLQKYDVPVLGWTVKERSVYDSAVGLFDNLIVEAPAL